MKETLRLSEILSCGAPVEWFEAVALAREIADRVRENLGGHSVPELHQIELMSDGRVSLSGASRTEEPVRRLGQLLQAALVDSDPPVQLRLLGSQATAAPPAFGSIREYMEALEYFERPDRSGILRGLYERIAAQPSAEARPMPRLDEIAPLLDAPPEKAKERAPRRQKASARRAVPAFVAAVVVVGGAAYWQLAAGRAASGRGVSELAVKASDAVGTALVNGISSVTDRVGLGRLSTAEGSRAAAAPSAPSPQTPPASRKRRRTARTTPSFRVFDLAPDVAAGLPATAIAPVPLPAAMSAPDLSAVVPATPDDNVYSASDPEVKAPIGVRPQLPAVLPGDVDKANLSKIEVLVLPDGTVGSVKLIGQPRSVLEGMLLSAAKAWTFLPARKGDQPVAYRKLVWLVLD